MTAQEVMEREDFQKCLEFHGHLCPGVSIGYRAARTGMAHLNQKRSLDEELISIVETDACSADAVQVLTGCTFGKGNFIYHDYGKMVFTFASRQTGRGVRVSLRPGAFEPDPEHMALLQKVIADQADETEKQRFSQIHEKRSHDILEMDEQSLFSIAETKIDLPDKAQIDPSVACDQCGEPTMAAKLVETKDGRRLCRQCHGENK